MPLQFTAAHASRITKRNAPPPLRRHSSSSTSIRRQTSSPSKLATTSSPPSKQSTKDPHFSTRLPDIGAPTPPRLPLPPGPPADNDEFSTKSKPMTTLPTNDLQHLITYIHHSAFTPLPTDRASGLGSELTARILNYRARLPPLATWAHVLALVESPTAVEREAAAAVARGEVRRVELAGRGRHGGGGKGGGGEGETIVKVANWEWVAREKKGFMGEDLLEKYVACLKNNTLTSSNKTFTPSEIATLIQCGLLNYVSANASVSNQSASNTSQHGIATAGSSAPSGSLAAVGGADAFHGAGGGLSKIGAAAGGIDDGHGSASRVVLAVPNTGQLLKLIAAARARLLEILRRLSPKYREAPLSVVREHWDGAFELGKRKGSGTTYVSPWKTKKWKEFYGLQFEWVLAECVGMGVVECFETGSVGLGIRAT